MSLEGIVGIVLSILGLVAAIVGREWILRMIRLTLTRIGSLQRIIRYARNGVPGTIFWTLGLIAALYLLTFTVFIFVPGSPTIHVPTNDIYVPHDQQAWEATILVDDDSLRGLMFREFFPRLPTLMQLKIVSKQGKVQLLHEKQSQSRETIILKTRPGDAIVIKYSFEEGYQFGDLNVFVYGRFDDMDKDDETERETIRFVRISGG